MNALAIAATTINSIRNRFAQVEVVSTEIFAVYTAAAPAIIEPLEQEITIPANFDQFLAEVSYRNDSSFADAIAALIDWENAVAELDSYFWNTADYPVMSGFDSEFMFDTTGLH